MKWVANLPLSYLGEYAKEIYQALVDAGMSVWIPLDNRNLVLKGFSSPKVAATNPLAFVKDRSVSEPSKEPFVEHSDGQVRIGNARFHYNPKDGVDINLPSMVLYSVISAGLMGMVWAVLQRSQVIDFANKIGSFVKGQPPSK